MLPSSVGVKSKHSSPRSTGVRWYIKRFLNSRTRAPSIRDAEPSSNALWEGKRARHSFHSFSQFKRLAIDQSDIHAWCDPVPRHQILLLLRAGPVSLHFYALDLIFREPYLAEAVTKPERRHRGLPLLLWTAPHRLIKPMSSHAIRARMTPKHSPQLE